MFNLMSLFMAPLIFVPTDLLATFHDATFPSESGILLSIQNDVWKFSSVSDSFCAYNALCLTMPVLT